MMTTRPRAEPQFLQMVTLEEIGLPRYCEILKVYAADYRYTDTNMLEENALTMVNDRRAADGIKIFLENRR